MRRAGLTTSSLVTWEGCRRRPGGADRPPAALPGAQRGAEWEAQEQTEADPESSQAGASLPGAIGRSGRAPIQTIATRGQATGELGRRCRGRLARRASQARAAGGRRAEFDARSPPAGGDPAGGQRGRGPPRGERGNGRGRAGLTRSDRGSERGVAGRSGLRTAPPPRRGHHSAGRRLRSAVAAGPSARASSSCAVIP